MHATSPDLRLLEPLSANTWLGQVFGGTTVAARWIGPSTPDDSDAVPQTLHLPADLRDDMLLPVLGLAHAADATWLLSELDSGIPVRRLLSRAKVTPLQSAVIVAEVHRALRALHAAGHWHGRVHPGNVHVDPTGRVRLGDWGPALLRPPSPPDGHRDADLLGLAETAGELAAQARRPLAPDGSRSARLLAALEAVAALDRVPSPLYPDPAPLADLHHTLADPDEQRRAHDELAVLVARLRRAGQPARPGAPALVPVPRQPADSAPPSAAQQTSAAQRPETPAPVATPPRLGGDLRRARIRRMWLTAVTVAILGAAVAAEFVVLGDDIRASWHRLTSTPDDQGPDIRTLVERDAGTAPAPAASGPITGVDLRPMAACTPGAICSVRVLVRVWPDDRRRIQVHWGLQVVDRCTGARTSRPVGVVEVPRGADRVDTLGHIQLPKGRSLAVFAVTSVPARAASPPLDVPAQGTPCR